MKRLECVAVQQDAYRLNVDELPTCLSVNVNDPELHRKLWSRYLTLEARDAHLVYSGSISCIR